MVNLKNMTKNCFFLLGLLLLITNIATSQKYQPIFGKYKTEYNFVQMSGSDKFITETYKYVNDTLINTSTYKHFVKNTYPVDNKYLRCNDSNSKVFLRKNDSDYCMMDLDLKIGDTFKVIAYVFVLQPLIVDSIFYDNNQKHIRFGSTISGYYDIYFEFIEGVGTNFGLFYHNCKSLSKYFYLLCAYRDSITTFINKIHTNPIDFSNKCYIDTSLQSLPEIPESNFNFYPNPCNESLTITIDPEYLKVNRFFILEIYDINGSIIHTEPLSNENSIVPINDLPGGIYFIRLLSKNYWLVLSQKAIIKK